LMAVRAAVVARPSATRTAIKRNSRAATLSRFPLTPLLTMRLGGGSRRERRGLGFTLFECDCP
jgi:hypothetical protein